MDRFYSNDTIPICSYPTLVKVGIMKSYDITVCCQKQTLNKDNERKRTHEDKTNNKVFEKVQIIKYDTVIFPRKRMNYPLQTIVTLIAKIYVGPFGMFLSFGF